MPDTKASETLQQIEELIERSKNDRAIIVGSEVRWLAALALRTASAEQERDEQADIAEAALAALAQPDGARERDAERYSVARQIDNWSHNMRSAKTPEQFDAACDSRERCSALTPQAQTEEPK